MGSGRDRARLGALDGLRGLAALVVFFHHTLQSPTGGYLGVDLFFVLSGFLITSILLRDLDTGAMPSFGQFYRRRAQRLLPAFGVMIALYACIRFCFSLAEPGVGPRAIFDVLLLSDLVSVIPYLSHCWSLAVEWQFYFVWPGLLTLLLLGGTGRLRAAVLAAGAVVAVWVMRVFYHVDIRIDGLLLGSALALVPPMIRGTPGRSVQYLYQGVLLLALIGVALLVFVSDYAGTIIPTWLGYAGMPLLGALMVAIVTRSSGVVSKALLENPVLVYFGRISYGFYLYHFPVAALMYTHGYSPVASAIAGLIVCVPLSDFSWRYIERPLLRLGAARTLATPVPVVAAG